MNRAAYFFLLVTVVLAAAMGSFHVASRSGGTLPVVDEAALQSLKQTSLPDHQGQPHTLNQWQGKILVINFWATWCPPCRREIPDFAVISQEYADAGVQVVGIGVDDADSVREYTKKFAIPYPILLGDTELFQRTQALGNHTLALPFTLILDREGRVVHAREGLFPAKALNQALTTLLAKPITGKP